MGHTYHMKRCDGLDIYVTGSDIPNGLNALFALSLTERLCGQIIPYAINGYMFGNLPGLSMCNNKKVKWYMFGMGNEVDIHSVYFYGQVLTLQHYRVDTINLFPATMVQGEMITDNIGKWLLTCQVNDHLEGGMQAIYEVRSCTEPTRRRKSSPQAHVRHYYIAAEQVLWNYGPSLTNHFTGEKLDDPESESAIYFEQTDMRIGGSYKKVVYVEYKDATFTKRKKRSAEEKHLGILGKLISYILYCPWVRGRVWIQNLTSVPAFCGCSGFH
ncbi:ceruloplasmin-like [Pelobates cultripes]|uniref:Ceruloplasmin-like, partial n=1 Tax=Pelobates cultripes TaxID=61616 RepID=A0AAD1S930_PELCU|nr:ceruloplasmin-like [Pelobates cultripes]